MEAYPTINLQNPYQFHVALICKLYGENTIEYFKEAWVPLLQEITQSGAIFKWASILSTIMT